jgi:Rho-binding antiterminator
LPNRETINCTIVELKFKKDWNYFSPLHELISTTSIVKEIVTVGGMPLMRLVTGEEIRLDQVVNIDHTPAPGYDIEDFTCDC